MAVLAGLVWAPRLAVYLAVATVGGAVLGMGNALTLVATQGVIRPERAGEASGVTKTVITVAAGLGVGLTGSVADPDGGAGAESATHTALLATAGGCLAACLVLLLWLWGPDRSHRRPYPAAARTGDASPEHHPRRRTTR
ncbi:hypothetical protein [Streptomyces morookaense]|uniref:Uncharacterized protein n=1 Tax=Streptomyces morookaense TaxID=1970 RepID=A0A7Y7E6D7_STRMO|nr:hypothetical protein [Streptomyces morookaense]NVK77760.1 hypothetical protein [Streptomyces morookaense]